MAKFAAAGWKVEFDADSFYHDLVIINTCGFILDAKQESVDMILEYARARKTGKIGKLCVIGCLAERYKNELKNEIPGIDLIHGINSIEELTREFCLDNIQCSNERFITTPSHYAYLKISEGCDRKCSFCVIPEIRGKHISRPVDILVNEAELLAGKGVRELILVAQDLTSYGIDLYGKNMLANLLLHLQSLKGIEWIRLHYAFPEGFPEEVLEIINDSKVICKYLDIPFQHISNKMLKIMRRGINRDKTLNLISKIRKKVPGIALRTTLLTGHPGETIDDFDELKRFVETVKFERLGVFSYSHEENTHSWKRFRDDLPDEEKARRVSEIMNIQQEISLSLNETKIGKIIKAVIDRQDDQFYYGRSEYDSPEVDNEIIIKKSETLVPGTFHKVKITGAGEFDLFAELVKR